MIKNYNKYLLWISLKNLKGVLENIDDISESLSSILDVLWLTKGIEDGVILINSHVKLRAEFLLRHADQEVSDELWNSLSNSSDTDSEDGVNSCSDFANEKVDTGWLWLLLLLLLRALNWHTVSVVLDLLWLVVSIWNN